jgi:hypothetical protein
MVTACRALRYAGRRTVFVSYEQFLDIPPDSLNCMFSTAADNHHLGCEFLLGNRSKVVEETGKSRFVIEASVERAERL